MAQRMIVRKINRLTLVRKSRGTAKHPALRDGVVEVVKAAPARPTTFDATFNRLLYPGVPPTRPPSPVEGLSYDDAIKALLRPSPPDMRATRRALRATWNQ